MRQALVIGALLLASAAARANEPPSPYRGLETRDIKALSEKDAADLLAGRGAGYAVAAELNGYPGPLHALELADKLALSRQQRDATQALFDAMQIEAKAVGAQIVAAEKSLNDAFAQTGIDKSDLTRRSEELGRLYGLYRAAHLKAHIDMKALLSPHQVALYDNLRGYGQAGNSHSPTHRPNH